MLWFIIFMHDRFEPAVRVVEGTEAEATELLLKARAVYDDPEARLVPFDPRHRDNDQIRADFALLEEEVS